MTIRSTMSDLVGLNWVFSPGAMSLLSRTVHSIATMDCQSNSAVSGRFGRRADVF
jgi:hypothetical protein